MFGVQCFRALRLHVFFVEIFTVPYELRFCSSLRLSQLRCVREVGTNWISWNLWVVLKMQNWLGKYFSKQVFVFHFSNLYSSYIFKIMIPLQACSKGLSLARSLTNTKSVTSTRGERKGGAVRDGRGPSSGSQNPENFKMKPGTRPGNRTKNFKTRNPARKSLKTLNPARNPAWIFLGLFFKWNIFCCLL